MEQAPVRRLGRYLDEFNRFWVFAALTAGRLLPVSASKLTECSGRDPGEQSLTSPLHPPAVGQSFFSVWASGLLGNKPRAQGPSRPCCQLGLRGCRAEPCRALQNCCIGIDAISQRLPRTRCSLSSMIINYSELCSLATQGNLYTLPGCFWHLTRVKSNTTLTPSLYVCGCCARVEGTGTDEAHVEA